LIGKSDQQRPCHFFFIMTWYIISQNFRFYTCYSFSDKWNTKNGYYTEFYVSYNWKNYSRYWNEILWHNVSDHNKEKVVITFSYNFVRTWLNFLIWIVRQNIWFFIYNFDGSPIQQLCFTTFSLLWSDTLCHKISFQYLL